MATEPSKSPNPHRERSVYIGERIKVLQTEIKALREEKRTLAASLKGMSDLMSPEAKKLKSRRVYLSKRPDDAKAELSQLVSERRSLADSIRAPE